MKMKKNTKSAVNAVKRPRGRPRKNPLPIETVVKRPRGRPRKNPLPIEPSVKRPRGRPRKNPLPTAQALPIAKDAIVRNKYGKKVEPLEPSNLVTTKFLGHCPSCKAIIGAFDLEKGTNKFNCVSCGECAAVDKLIQKIETDRPKTKREYLENSILTDSDYEPRVAKVVHEEVPHEIIDTISVPTEKENDESDENIEID